MRRNQIVLLLWVISKVGRGSPRRLSVKTSEMAG